MRILFLSQLVPLPLDAGPKIRSYFVLRHLVAAGHQVTLLCFSRPEDKSEGIEELRRLCSVRTVPIPMSRTRDAIHAIQSLFSGKPFLIQRDEKTAMKRAVQEAADGSSFDAVHADQLWMSPYGLLANRVSLTVMDQHNAVFLIPRRLAENQRNPLIRTALEKESRKLLDYERRMCRSYRQTVWVSEADRKSLTGASDNPGMVIPIAVDPAGQQPVKTKHPFRVTFVGGMHWPPNLEAADWLVERVWPQVHARMPEAVLTLVGKCPGRSRGRWSRRPQVHVAGYAPELAPYLEETAVFVAPFMSGAGMRVKILGAWCSGLPVVSTTVGAEGIQTAPKENILLADDEDSFAEAVLEVLNDRGMARRLSENGRGTVESLYDWRRAYPAWDTIYH
jgi:polysaccharide biosynthesis protein PslH